MIGLNTFSGSVIINDVNAECNYEVRTSENVPFFSPLSLCFFSKFLSLAFVVILSDFMSAYPFLEILIRSN